MLKGADTGSHQCRDQRTSLLQAAATGDQKCTGSGAWELVRGAPHSLGSPAPAHWVTGMAHLGSSRSLCHSSRDRLNSGGHQPDCHIMGLSQATHAGLQEGPSGVRGERWVSWWVGLLAFGFLTFLCFSLRGPSVMSPKHTLPSLTATSHSGWVF